MYLDQAPLPEVVALRAQTPLTPDRRRITIRRRAGGGYCAFRRHPRPGGHRQTGLWQIPPRPGVSSDAYDMTSGSRVSGTERRRATKNTVQLVCWMHCTDLASLIVWSDVRRASRQGRALRTSGQRRREAPA